MSDVSHKFTVSTSIATLCDKESGRFALSGVHVAPAADGGAVSLVATDGRRLAATIEEGSATRPAIVRGDALKVSSRPIGAELNGALKVSTPGAKRGAPAQVLEYATGEVDGRFPRHADVFPNDVADYVFIALDYDFLSKMAAAIRPATGTEDSRGIEIGICMTDDKPAVFMFRNNIGLIMPMADDTKFEAAQEAQRLRYLKALVKHGFRPASILDPPAAPVESAENPAIELAQEMAQEVNPETAPPAPNGWKEIEADDAPVIPPQPEAPALELPAAAPELAPLQKCTAPDSAIFVRGAWRLNPRRGGVEIRFPSAPRANVRHELRRAGFRWSARQGLWYAKSTIATRTKARELANIDESAANWVITPSAPVNLTPKAPRATMDNYEPEAPAQHSENVSAFLAMIGG